MCGVAGIVGPLADRVEVVARMTASLAHRGPDDHGAYDDGECSLGHRRLSIIDLSPSGRQPMTNEDGTIQLAYNGEIYNFQELRSELLAHGHRFRSRTDTEVLVHGYEQWGVGLLTRVRGMFALAVWDRPRRRLLLARDHFGQKPLFYAQQGTTLLFASEIKALLAAGIPTAPDHDALDLLLRIQLVPSPRTCFAAIRRLPPATVLIREASGEISLRRYWTLAEVAQRRISFDAAVDEAAALCRSAVNEQLVADVPVGVFVSGGIDSSVVLTSIGPDVERPQSFTLGYDEAAYSEVEAAQRATAGRATDHHVIVMRPADAADPERLVSMFDEPFPDVAALPLAHLARHARAHVTVALTGDGGDETFAGYEHHVLGYWLGRLARFQRIGSMLAGVGMAATSRLSGARAQKLTRLLNPLAQPSPAAAIAALRTTVTDDLRRQLYTPAFLDRATTRDAATYLATDGGSIFCPSGDLFLADRLLMKSDMATMASGLETRSPLLDLRLAELAVALPADYKISRQQGKQVLRRVLAHSTSKEVWRRPKRGFSMPLDEWMKTELRDLVSDTLLATGALVHDYLRHDVLARMYREHCDGKANWRRILWTALLIELWLRRARRSSAELSADRSLDQAAGLNRLG